MLHSVKFNTPNTKHTCLQIDAFVESLQWELDDQRSAAGAIIAAADDRDAAGVSSAADEEEGSGSAVLTRESPRLPSAAASGEGMRQGFLVRSMPTHQPPPPPPTHTLAPQPSPTWSPGRRRHAPNSLPRTTRCHCSPAPAAPPIAAAPTRPKRAWARAPPMSWPRRLRRLLPSPLRPGRPRRPPGFRAWLAGRRASS